MYESKKILSFDFVKAGKFILSGEPCQFKNWQSHVLLKLIDEKFERADETAYVIICETTILYVGEYAYNLRDRWHSKNYVNHHMHNNIKSALEEGRELSLWVAISPYIEITEIENPELRELNLSKSLEQHILKHYLPEWNLRNKNSSAKEWRKKHSIRLDSFIKNP